MIAVSAASIAYVNRRLEDTILPIRNKIEAATITAISAAMHIIGLRLIIYVQDSATRIRELLERYLFPQKEEEEEDNYQTVFSADEEHQKNLIRYIDTVLAAMEQTAESTRRPKDIWMYFTAVKVAFHRAAAYLPTRLSWMIHRKLQDIERIAYDKRAGPARWAKLLRETSDLAFLIMLLLRKYGVVGRYRRKEPDMKEVAKKELAEIVKSLDEAAEELANRLAVEDVTKQERDIDEDEPTPEDLEEFEKILEEEAGIDEEGE